MKGLSRGKVFVNERWYICHGSVEIVDEIWMMSKQDASPIADMSDSEKWLFSF